MKVRILGIAIGLPLTVVATPVYADTLNTSGFACVALHGDEQDNVWYNTGHIQTNGVATTVACPVPREVGNRAMTVYIDLLHSVSTSTSCTVHVADQDGTPFTSKSVTASGSNRQRVSASFTSSQNPGWAYTWVQCNLTGSSSLFGVTAAY